MPAIRKATTRPDYAAQSVWAIITLRFSRATPSNGTFLPESEMTFTYEFLRTVNVPMRPLANISGEYQSAKLVERADWL